MAQIPDDPMQDRAVTNIGKVSPDATSNIIQLSGWQVRHDVRATDGATVYTIRVGDGSYVKLTRDQFLVNPEELGCLTCHRGSTTSKSSVPV